MIILCCLVWCSPWLSLVLLTSILCYAKSPRWTARHHQTPSDLRKDMEFLTVYNMTLFTDNIIGVPEQALGWFPLGLGLVVEDMPSELSCSHTVITASKMCCIFCRKRFDSLCIILLHAGEVLDIYQILEKTGRTLQNQNSTIPDK